MIYTGDTVADCTRLREIARTPGLKSLDFETTIARARDREVCTIQITHENGEEGFAYIYPDGKRWLQYIFDGQHASEDWLAFNAQFEAECLVNAGVFIYPQCAMVAAKVIRGKMEGDKAKRTGWSLKDLAARELNKTRDKTIRDNDWRERPTPEMVEYGMEDTRDALALWAIWKSEFDRRQSSWSGYRQIMDALPACVEINLTGLPFDPDAHDTLMAQLGQQLAEHTFMLDLLSWGMIDNHGSTKQVAQWMRRVMLAGRPAEQQASPKAFSMIYQQATGEHWPMTDSGEMSLDRAAVETRLASLTKVSPDVAAYLLQRLQWSKVAKQLQAFGAALHAFVDERGYIVGSLRLHGAQTSRLSCQSPNLQQMPAEPEFRALFKAKPGRKLIVADYSQIELRVAAMMTNELTMLGVFARKEDIHQATADYIKRLLLGDPDAVGTKQERKDGKPVTFSVLYGAQAPTVAASSGLPLEQAELLLDTWLRVYPGIREYRDTAFSSAQADGGVTLASGQFIAMAPDTRPAMAINSPVQGSAASVMYRSMTLTHNALLRARAAGHDIWYAASIHDENILDAAEEDAEVAQELLQDAMCRALMDVFPQTAALGMAESAEAAAVDSWAEK